MSWLNKSLREIAIDLASGGRPQGGAIENGIFSIGAEHLDGNGGFNLSNGKYIPIDFYNSIGKGKIKPGDILLVKDGATTGKVSFVSEDFPLVDAAINEHVFRIELNQSFIDPKYCFYYLVSSEGQKNIMSDFRGATVGGISKSILDKIQIPLPPLETQKRIANILDAADALRKKDQELLKKYDELTQAIFIEMFGDPVKNEKGWECLIGKEYADRISVGVVIKPASYYVNSGIPALRSQNVKPNRITKDNLVYFSQETNDNILFKSKIYTGDVLIVRTGQPGTSAVVTDDFNEVNCIDMLIVSPKKEIISPHYLAFFMNSEAGKNYIALNQKGQIQQHFNVGDINKFKIPVPPISLQQKFEKNLINIKKISALEYLTSSEKLFHSLLQKAFNGELVA